MKQIPFIVLICSMAVLCSFCPKDVNKNDHEKAAIIKTYFSGWVKKDWSIVSGTLAEGFTFTSPADDDHIPVDKFKDKCWVQAQHIQKFEFIKIIENENDAFALLECHTTDNATFRNTEYFTFSNGKIKSIEVYFGPGRGYPTGK